MANKTIISDIVVPEVFNPYVIQRTAELSALVQSGIVVPKPELDRLASAGGKLINMPYFDDLTGDDEVLSDTGALTPGKIEADTDVAALLARGRAWSVNDLAAVLSGDDPMGAIADLVAEYWNRREQAILISTLEGAMAGTNMSDNVHDISSAGTDEIDASTTLDAVQKLGDNKERLTAFAMHSAVENALAKEDLIDYIRESEASPRIPTYMGKRVIVDDSLTPTGDVYTTYIFGEGAIGRGEGGAPVPVETDRDSLAGDDILIHRRHFILHPRGIKFLNDTVGGATPSNTELANNSNWARAYESKNIRIVQFKHKI